MSSNLPISSKYRSMPTESVDDHERDRLTQRLNAAYSDGVLDVDDYQQRLDRLYAAQTLGELVPVVEGLPPVTTYDQPGIVEQGTLPPGEVSQARPAGNLALWAGGSVAIGLLILIVLLVILL